MIGIGVQDPESRFLEMGRVMPESTVESKSRPPIGSDRGFTLVELLVVVIIIGILAAIAIPTFFNQRKKGVDASLKTDLQQVASAEETYFVDHQQYSSLGGSAPTYTVGVGSSQIPVRTSPGNTLIVSPDVYGSGTYCVAATNGSGSQIWIYKSSAGGMQTLGTTSC
jgi:type IV pilus assembly protein PilA